MAATTLFSGPFVHIVDATGIPLAGAQITTFTAGTTSVLPVFHDAALSVAWTQPLVTNAAGNTTDPVYVSPTPAVKIVVVTATGGAVPGYPMDNWSPSAVAS
jgi:hypothetical protein